jgi:preprotein translocase subunit Sss1
MTRRRIFRREYQEAAVVMIFGIPMAAMYTFFRVRKLRSEERLAAIARGMDVPMQAELSESARSRRSGILLVAGAIGYIVTFTLIGRVEPDAMIAATFGVIPLAVGLGFFVDYALIRRDARAH